MSEPTIHIPTATGVWRQVYGRRLALHAAADDVVLSAWRQDVRGLDLAQAAAVLTESQQPTDHRREAAAAAVLALLSARSWRRTRRALATAAKRSHRAGWAAGQHLTSRDRDDDTPYDDSANSDTAISRADMSDHNADGTATAALTAALAATARRAGRDMAGSTDPADDGEDTVDAGDDLLLAADVVVSAAYGAGLLSAYLSSGVGAVEWMTAGDGRVCQACLANEAGSPYSLYGAPRLPAHPRCRCVLAPA